MSRDLALHTSSSAVATSAPDAGSASTAGLDWSARPLTFDDLPAESIGKATAAGVLAESVTKFSGIRTDRRGVSRLRGMAFRAYPDRLVLLPLSRRMEKRANGSYAPTGKWAVDDVQTLQTAGGARVLCRAGKVKPGRLVSGVDGASGLGTPVSREMETAVNAESFLPAEVRCSLATAVPQPTTHLGGLIRWVWDADANGRVKMEQEVIVLRLNGARAVLVKAVRDDTATASWHVEQRTYDLRSDSRALSA